MDTFITWVIPIIFSCIITTVIGIIIKRSFDKYFKMKDEIEQSKKQEESELQALKQEKLREERKADIKEAIAEEVKPLSDKLDSLDTKLDANSTGTITLLRDRMKCSLNYCTKQGFATATDKANWMELYNSYKALGGNHFREYVDQWKAEMESLPNEKVKKTSTKK